MSPAAALARAREAVVRAPRRLVVVGAVLLVLVAALVVWRVVASQGDEPVAKPVPIKLQSAIEDPFEFVEHAGATWLVGHRLVIEVDPTWHVYDSERASLDDTSWEYAAGEPEPEESAADADVPTYLAIYAGIPNRSASFDEVRDRARADAEQQDGYALVAEGAVDVPGAEQAAYLRFTRQVDYRGQQRTVEEVSYFLQVEPGVTTRVRAFAPAGEFDAAWDKRLGTLQVSP
ncbi:hypothetical protein [Nocardioides sp. AE5]|uniref:hypothetical protein n=1 Tax=Nocardioides sp. AE5 TaxID=2962573 RepID=UPI002882645A|nr:hypothetical protein [Nocardioides sp. AE5]MDT0203815.1 hypothetical protein [Nocardioides sp. AE5]